MPACTSGFISASPTRPRASRGKHVAEWAFNHFLLPLDDDDHKHGRKHD